MSWQATGLERSMIRMYGRADLEEVIDHHNTYTAVAEGLAALAACGAGWRCCRANVRSRHHGC
ncbi:MAG: hypothetical protein AB8G14_17260 [Ilumatobacter sp.]